MKKILLLIVGCLLLSGCWETRKGEKVGVIVKVGKEGMFWGTYEGELVRGGLQDASGANGQAFHFSFGQFDSSLVKRALIVMKKNKPVVISYHCEAFVAPWRSDNNCFADNIEEHTE